MRTFARISAAISLAAVLSSCSQISALAPVSGDQVTGLRTAATDVLLEKGYELLVVPVCTEDGDDYSCTGTTLDNHPISVSASGEDSLQMTVHVGSDVVFEGDVNEVLQRFADVPK